MKKRCLSICLTVLSILILILSTAQTNLHVIAASPPSKTLTGYIPSAVTDGEAHLIGQHPGTDQLALAIGLPLRNVQALTQLLNEASTPRNPHYRHYLTLTQENQAFNPTSQQEQQVMAWLQANGLMVTHTYPNHLLVDTTGTFAQVERLLHITLNDYTTSLDGKTTAFYAPATEPTLPGSVTSLVNSIVGLDNFPLIHADNATAHPTFTNGNANSQPPFYPQDFANAYDVNPLWNLGDTGSNQHIAITLWGTPPSDATLNKFAQQTGANVATQANGRLRVIQVPCSSGCNYKTLGGTEAALDVESSSGIAPGATIDYYQIPTNKYGNPTTAGEEDALNLAGSDGYDTQISNSWGRECETQDAFTTSVESILQSNTATGHDYLFASGDTGSTCSSPLKSCQKVQNPYPIYPASSAYVTSVGGTKLSIQNNSWQSEIAWDYTKGSCHLGSGNPPQGSGGGYSKLFAQPSWQVGFSQNKYRGYPDVSADAELSTGAYICYDVSNGTRCGADGGTSLASPLWAGMIADVNQYVLSQNKLPLGFINPLLYEMQTGMLYTAYHDIKIGTNGKYPAGLGWDAVTGLGSPDLYNLARDAASLDFSNASGLTGIAAVSATDVWAIGNYSDSNDNGLTLIEQWNGTNWNVVSSPNPGSGQNNNTLTSVTAVSANNVWAVGYYYNSSGVDQMLSEQWNGASWNVVPDPTPSDQYQDPQLYGVAAVSANDVWAVGSYSNSSGVVQTLIEQWNGTSWNVVPSPSPGSSCPGSICNNFDSVVAVSANDVWAVGYEINASGNYQTLIEQWNGTSWNVVPSPNPSGQHTSIILNGVAAVSANDVWAVGYYDHSTLIEQWNGTSWNVVPSPNPSQFDNGLSDVAAVSTNDAWAVGYDSNPIDNYPQTLTAQWNGSTWNVIPSP
jgi:subtilase family serine protease